MFDSLSDRLGATLDGLKGKGRLSEDDINKAMREIRLALLEADVNAASSRTSSTASGSGPWARR